MNIQDNNIDRNNEPNSEDNVFVKSFPKIGIKYALPVIKYSFIRLSNPVDLSHFKSRIPRSNSGSVKGTSSSSNTLSSEFGSLFLSMLLSSETKV
jgi:hypothetical protein